MSKNESSSKKTVKQDSNPSRLTGYRRTSLKKRILQRVIIALIFSAGVITAQEMGWLDNITQQFAKQKVNWLDNKAVIAYLRTVITHQKLTDTPQKCLVFVINNDMGGDSVDIAVKEQHNAICTDTRTDFPTLFTFRVNRQNGNIQIDKNTPNHFYPIQ
ncbi:hypothetical protein [Commensalibacter oyaizuii]|uniref:Uncharacterized protein n=1 Tax=Commensalibacter oyaizuii TaxID=3043873 RepID=A0ABT6Q0W0_9PROT|nr:hypothetical protein [Commensalibacter sp. TBRC 16381]MDI2090748.1 hypothetical protein [Commensalibacter sp. TBRC 16381]